MLVSISTIHNIEISTLIISPGTFHKTLKTLDLRIMHVN